MARHLGIAAGVAFIFSALITVVIVLVTTRLGPRNTHTDLAQGKSDQTQSRLESSPAVSTVLSPKRTEPTLPTPKSVDTPQPVGSVETTQGAIPAILLQKRAMDASWQRLAAGAVVHSGDVLLSLPGSRSEVRTGSGIGLTLWGNLGAFAPIPTLESCIVLNAPTDGLDVDCTLDHGVLVLTNRKTMGPVRARVHFFGTTWDVHLAEPSSAVALVLWSECPTGAPIDKQGTGTSLVSVLDVMGLHGTVEIRTAKQRLRLPIPGWYSWQRDGLNERLPEPIPEEAIRWYSDKNLPDTPQANNARQALLELDKSLQGRPIAEALAELRTHSKGQVLALSMYCTIAVGDVTALVNQLAEARSDARLFASKALRNWIGLRPEHERQLFEALQSRHSDLQAETILQLLHGFSKDDWRKVETYECLIDRLTSDSLIIRDLSAQHLQSQDTEGKKIGYDPMASVADRKRAIQLWAKLLEAGKLPPPLPKVTLPKKE
jgi:hypothetical protein